MKRALLRTIIRAQSEGTLLDSEDEEMMVRYGMGEITKAELDSFVRRKAEGLRRSRHRTELLKVRIRPLTWSFFPLPKYWTQSR